MIGEYKEIDVSGISASDEHRSSLTQQQEDRVCDIADALAEVFPQTYDEWVHGFCCDASPEREIRVWEAIAKAYSSYVDGRNFSLEAKEEVLDLALSKSFGMTHQQIMEEPAKYLDWKDKVEFLAHWTR